MLFETMIIGGGAAADAFLSAVVDAEQADKIFKNCCFVSPSEGSMMGVIDPDVDSNSAIEDFFVGNYMPQPVFQEMTRDRRFSDPFPLHLLGDFFAERKKYFADLIKQHKGRVIESFMNSLYWRAGCFEVRLTSGALVSAKKVVLCIGARPKAYRIEPLRFQIHGHHVLFDTSVADYRLKSLVAQPQLIEIRGRGASAATALRLFSRYSSECRYMTGNFALYYDSVGEAENSGYKVDKNGVCPKTGRVNRYFGIRGRDRDHYAALLDRNDENGNSIVNESVRIPDLTVECPGYEHVSLCSNLRFEMPEGLLRTNSYGEVFSPGSNSSGTLFAYGLGVWADRHEDDGGENIPGPIRAYNVFYQRALRALKTW